MSYKINNPVMIQRCKGAEACINAVLGKEQAETLISAIEEITDHTHIDVNLSGGALARHRNFLISLSMCPNACSRPQIADIGLIGALVPKTAGGLCSGCGSCVSACRECAVRIDNHDIPVINKACLYCGACVSACGSGAIVRGESGFRILLGGKLGRHPFLARELPGIYTISEIRNIIHFCFNFYLKNFEKTGMRLGDFIRKNGISWLPEHLLQRDISKNEFQLESTIHDI